MIHRTRSVQNKTEKPALDIRSKFELRGNIINKSWKIKCLLFKKKNIGLLINSISKVESKP